jgi:hypothetical protein
MDQKFSLGNIGITDYLIVRCRLVSSPGADAAPRQALGPAPPTNQNVVFTGLNPDFYYFDVYESIDGTALTSLINTFEINVSSNQILSETRRYVVDRGNVGDPNDGATSLDDVYLNGKTITNVIQRNFGPLALTDEYTRTSTGIALVPPLAFTSGDSYFILISYPAGASPVAPSGPFNSEIDVTANATLDATYYNKTINCNGSGSRLVITLDHLGGVTDGSQFLFIDQEGGTQLQTKIIPQSGDFIKWKGTSMSEIWIGKGEWIILKKRGLFWKVVQAHEGLNMLGLRFSAQLKGHVNTLPEDGVLYDADDYPRAWWFINQLPSTLAVVDNTLDSVGYTRPANKQGQFIYSITKRKFRTPNTQGLSEKALADFSTYNADASRAYDYPGGFQAEQVGQFSDVVVLPLGNSFTGSPGGGWTQRPGKGDANPQNESYAQTFNSGKSNIVKNIGIIYLRCV